MCVLPNTKIAPVTYHSYGYCTLSWSFHYIFMWISSSPKQEAQNVAKHPVQLCFQSFVCHILQSDNGSVQCSDDQQSEAYVSRTSDLG